MALYNPTLLVEMECPVCTEYMHPPIRQCTAGHSICNNCYYKLRQCATCRQPLSQTARTFALEKLHAKLIFPCKNRENGCCQIDIGMTILEHEKTCIYGNQPCPLRVINNCEWLGQMKDMTAHCKLHHPNNIFCTTKQKLTCTNFLTNSITSSTYFFIIFNVYDKFFKCAWDVNFDTGLMRWCVFLMGNQDICQRYHYEIEIRNQNNLLEGVIVRSHCPVMKPDCDDAEIFNNTQFMVTHYDMIKDYCKNDDLIYTVSIKKDFLE